MSACASGWFSRRVCFRSTTRSLTSRSSQRSFQAVMLARRRLGQTLLTFGITFSGAQRSNRVGERFGRRQGSGNGVEHLR